MICLVAGKVIAPLMAGAITLAWTHSVEKILWEEDWRSGAAGLELLEARVRGSGAGMEPPPEARFKEGVYSWRPSVPPQREIVLRRSGATADWRICIAGQCRPMDTYVPAEADPVVMKPCERP
ncbi:DUF1850 domain-containing protein [Microvirga subterranea]|uniref:DUF1850 domain-containing protein n=1 Tax=Microvirga subterranea TaxID=186651 RepID=A0A370HGV0_9HYPH|nr:DUF1850 domain-containing protein [Microvirga subterranea]RDI57118.1 hypothetical protein DES45_10733 [Microvirga subterranea]